jgi:hypothetical protein
MKRDFSLPGEDMEWLENRGQPYELVADGGILRVVVFELAVPAGYNVQTIDANIRIEPGYPDTQIDMVYFFPDLFLLSGRSIGALSTDSFMEKTWQRWSRHRTGGNPWRPGIDNIATHFALVHEWLEREVRKV